ncbi:hypothetical protein EDD22DRAFT_844831 [Suillus occidentalis]|nr:hypothetical protein EDD22DRAFT_844831 [Suillus occidentalis]
MDEEVLQDHADTAHLCDQLYKKDTELIKLCKEVKNQDDAEYEAREQMDYLTTNSVWSLMAEEAFMVVNEEERTEEQTRIVKAHEALQTDKNSLADTIQCVSLELKHITLEHTTTIKITHKDLDAAHQESTELHNNIEDLQNDNEALKADLEALKTKLLDIEEGWSEECDTSISTLTTTLLSHTDKAKPPPPQSVDTLVNMQLASLLPKVAQTTSQGNDYFIRQCQDCVKYLEAGKSFVHMVVDSESELDEDECTLENVKQALAFAKANVDQKRSTKDSCRRS